MSLLEVVLPEHDLVIFNRPSWTYMCTFLNQFLFTDCREVDDKKDRMCNESVDLFQNQTSVKMPCESSETEADNT